MFPEQFFKIQKERMEVWSEYGNKDQETLSEKLKENWLNWLAEYNSLLEEEKIPQDTRIETMR